MRLTQGHWDRSWVQRVAQTCRPPCFPPLQRVERIFVFSGGQYLFLYFQDDICIFRRVTERKLSLKTLPQILFLALGFWGRGMQNPYSSRRFQDPPKWQNKMAFLPPLLFGTLISVFISWNSKMFSFFWVLSTPHFSACESPPHPSSPPSETLSLVHRSPALMTLLSTWCVFYQYILMTNLWD